MQIRTYYKFQELIETILRMFKNYSNLVHTEKWQGMNIQEKPDMATWELLNQSFKLDVSQGWNVGNAGLDYWRNEIRPNMPWADDHFEERVGGEPLNPGVEWANWPYAKSADRFRTNEQFTHSYMERYWPKYAGQTPGGILPTLPSEHNLQVNRGYRYPYGDLRDVIKLLASEPLTRQAYFPVWFPEDTGVVHGGRVPCSLGYHFIRRDRWLHVVYYLRSCDFVRHFRDDVYLTLRLLEHVLKELRKVDPKWLEVVPGTLTMHMTSLHIFRNDRRMLGIDD